MGCTAWGKVERPRLGVRGDGRDDRVSWHIAAETRVRAHEPEGIRSQTLAPAVSVLLAYGK